MPAYNNSLALKKLIVDELYAIVNNCGQIKQQYVQGKHFYAKQSSNHLVLVPSAYSTKWQNNIRKYFLLTN